MKKSSNIQIIIFLGVVLAVLIGFYLIKDSSENTLDTDITAQNSSLTFDEAIITEIYETSSSELKEENASTAEEELNVTEENRNTDYYFRSSKLLNQHYQKHGINMGFSSAEEYEKAASEVVNNPNALHKTEAEDGDDIYYIETTNEFVVVSTDGYIRTYFNPDKGIDYYNKQ